MNEIKGVGRPKIEISWEILDAILQRGATLKDCAAIMEVSHDLIEKRIYEKTGQRFGEYREDRMSKTKLKLIEKALSLAFNGNVSMMIFCLKNVAGWSDNVSVDDTRGKIITLKYSLDPEKTVNEPDKK